LQILTFGSVFGSLSCPHLPPPYTATTTASEMIEQNNRVYFQRSRGVMTKKLSYGEDPGEVVHPDGQSCRNCRMEFRQKIPHPIVCWVDKVL